MYQIKVNGFEFETEHKNQQVIVNGGAVDLNLLTISENRFHIIHQHKSYLAEVLEVDYPQKTFKIKVNNGIYNLMITDEYDALLKNLGLDNLSNSQLKEIKAPMPGLVLKILVEEKSEVKKGDNLLVLEAMKMENIIKAPADFIVKKVNIKAGDKVEKNQVMIILE